MFDFSDTAACFPFFPPDFEYSAWAKKKEYQSYGAISIKHQCTISDKEALQWAVCTIPKSPIINGRSSVTPASATPRDNGILLKICRRFWWFLEVKIYISFILVIPCQLIIPFCIHVRDNRRIGCISQSTLIQWMKRPWDTVVWARAWGENLYLTTQKIWNLRFTSLVVVLEWFPHHGTIFEPQT